MSTKAMESSANKPAMVPSSAEIEEALMRRCSQISEGIESASDGPAHWVPELFDKIDASSVAECCWGHLPRGVKAALNGSSLAGINGEFEIINDGFVKVLILLRRIISGLSNDPVFDWNLWQSARSSYILASDLLLNDDQMRAVFMVFCGALFQECLASGHQFVRHVLEKYAQMKVFDTKQGKAIAFGQLFQLCAYIRGAVDHTRSPKAMATFLAKFLGSYEDTSALANRLTDLREGSSDSPIHSFVAHGQFSRVIRLSLILIDSGDGATLSDGSPSSFHQFEVYTFTPLRWLFHLCLSINNENNNAKGFLGGSWAVPTVVRPRILLAGELYYLATSGNKTLKDVGVEEDTVFIFSFDIRAAEKTTSTKKKKGRRKQKVAKKSVKKANQEHVPSQPSSELLREQHSMAMEPVLDELRPHLKVIREQLASQSLEKSRPKARKPKKRSVGKENTSNNVASMLPSSSGAKAGKAVYPVLVGEPSNLHQTARLRPGNRPRTITLDLHGCSRDEALERLNKGLKEWVERAMKGHHPFVIPVDIVCGGGSQVLSELVAQFIRENAQIANRPRGLA